MGYFSNGSEGDYYQAEYCERCVHDADGNCTIWFLHLIYNYEQNDNDTIRAFLNALIPTNGASNEQCSMFIPITSLQVG